MSEDPARVFARIAADHPRAFWLDGGGSRDWSGRRSMVGWLEPDDVSLTYDAATMTVWRHQAGRREPVGDDIFASLAAEVDKDSGDPGVNWVGYFGYASRPDLPARVTASPAAPDAMWMRSRSHHVFDHDPADLSEPTVAPATVGSDKSVREAYGGWFERVQEQLRLGNSYQVNLTYREELVSRVDPVTAYLRLRRTNPAPYAAFLQHDDVRVLSSSPERFATIDRHRWVETKPIKGTTPRGETEAEDETNRRRLAGDPRYRSENLIIVDLLRNDLSMVCEPGTVTVPQMMEVESYPSVHQLVSTVRGHLRDDVRTLDALRTIFPAGSMTGAPKLRTMQIIADVETSPRGVYAGALGWISADGRADLGVVIRTLVCTEAEQLKYRYTLGTGGGITVRSDAASEFEETRWKAAKLLAALHDT